MRESFQAQDKQTGELIIGIRIEKDLWQIKAGKETGYLENKDTAELLRKIGYTKSKIKALTGINLE